MGHAVGFALATYALTNQAHAFSVATGFTEGCHERVTLTAYIQAKTRLPQGDDDDVPEGDWERIADYLFERANYQAESRSEKFLLFGLLTGVRAPDSEGLSLTNVAVLRAIHENPKGQYEHCLRAISDDYEAGNRQTALGCRQVIEDLVVSAVALNRKLGAQQLIDVPMTLDQYGTFSIPVWGVSYYIGRALHALQDSFTHTLRTEDLRSVVHFMNYVEAIGGSLEEARDGLPHSAATDGCALLADTAGNQPNRERFFAAAEASADLLGAVSRAIFEGAEAKQETLVVMDKWLQYRSGKELGFEKDCSESNDYCDSPWLDSARESPTESLLCTVGRLGRKGAADESLAAWGLRCTLLGLPLLGLLLRRSRLVPRRNQKVGHVR